MGNGQLNIRDIYIPEGVDIFPLAYGWYVILLVIFALFFAIKFWVWAFKTSKKRFALKKLKNIDINEPVEAAIKMSNLLKRVCNIKHKDATVLYGKEWVEFLSNTSKMPADKSAMELLAYAPFMDKKNSKFSKVEANNLKEFCKMWIGDNI